MKRCKAFHTEHDNGDHFLIAYDYASGRKNRYTTLVWRVGETARIIGRELTLGQSKQIVKHYPKRVPTVNIFAPKFKVGDRVTHWDGAYGIQRIGTVDNDDDFSRTRHYRVVYGPHPFVDGQSSWNMKHESDLESVTALDLLAEI